MNKIISCAQIDSLFYSDLFDMQRPKVVPAYICIFRNYGPLNFDRASESEQFANSYLCRFKCIYWTFGCFRQFCGEHDVSADPFFSFHQVQSLILVFKKTAIFLGLNILQESTMNATGERKNLKKQHTLLCPQLVSVNLKQILTPCGCNYWKIFKSKDMAVHLEKDLPKKGITPEESRRMNPSKRHGYRKSKEGDQMFDKYN